MLVIEKTNCFAVQAQKLFIDFIPGIEVSYVELSSYISEFIVQ
jgi:hypothetical protein